MKKYFSVLLMVFSLQMISFGQAGKPAAQKTVKKEKEIHAALKNWADAVVSRNMNALGKIFADDLIVTDQNGGTRGKAQELEVLKPSPEVKTVSVVNEEVRIRNYGKAAVVTAVTKMRFVIGGKDVNTVFRYTAVFVRQGGRWQITALQTARVAPVKQN